MEVLPVFRTTTVVTVTATIWARTLPNRLYDRAMAISDIFTRHPASVGQTWVQHCRFALSVSRTLTVAAVAAAVHAVVPALCETTASRAVDRLHAQIHGLRDADAGMVEPTEFPLA